MVRLTPVDGGCPSGSKAGGGTGRLSNANEDECELRTGRAARGSLVFTSPQNTALLLKDQPHSLTVGVPRVSAPPRLEDHFPLSLDSLSLSEDLLWQTLI